MKRTCRKALLKDLEDLVRLKTSGAEGFKLRLPLYARERIECLNGTLMNVFPPGKDRPPEIAQYPKGYINDRLLPKRAREWSTCAVYLSRHTWARISQPGLPNHVSEDI